MKKLIVFVFMGLLLSGCGGIEIKTPNEQTHNLKVHFLDVGQGDCILVQFPDGRNMLVDAGKNESAGRITDYLNKTGVKKLDFVVGTHPHEDHIGSLDVVLQRFQIGAVFMPKVTTNTKTFRDVLEAVKDKGLKIKTAKSGVNLVRTDSLSVDIIAPQGTAYKSLNDYSAVIKISYDQVSFLLAGDAEAFSEREVLSNSAISPKADVLKVAHHGSRTSTSNAFLQTVAPKVALISLGAGNDYHYPHKSTLDRLKKAGIKILRTDEKGTVVISTNGKEMNITTEK